jgi:hypothetical protein
VSGVNRLDWNPVDLDNCRGVTLGRVLEVHDENPDVDPMVDETGSARSSVRRNLNVA